jgi:hypothetical protein
MSTWAGVTPLIGVGSLDGFAVGALMSGACSLAIVVPRRGRRRQVAAACHGLALAVGRPEKLGQHVKLADLPGAGPERRARSAELGAPDASFLASRGSGPSGGYRSRHRRGDPIPSRDGTGRDGTGRDGTGRGGAGWAGLPRIAEPRIAEPRTALPRTALPRVVVPGFVVPGTVESRTALPRTAVPGAVVPRPRTSRHAAFPDSAFPGREPSGDGARPHLVFPELVFPDGTSGNSKRPDGRGPRHAAPAVGFSSKMTTWMTSLVPARAVASGVHG